MTKPVDDALEREKQQIEASVFVGEEGEDPSTPTMDMGAALFLAAFALAAIYLAWGLDVPNSLYTAPGLLPILTGLTLFGMALGLARRALKHGASAQVFDYKKRLAVQFFSDEENRRGFLLICIIAAYIFAIDFFGFELRFPLGWFTFQFGSYEFFSILAMLIILKLFWRASYLHCFLVSAGWVMTLGAIFRYGFRILLPGSG